MFGPHKIIMAAVTVRLYWCVALLVLTLIGTSFSSQNMLCPSSCSCLGSLVHCSRKGLIDIPKDLPIWVEILDLQNNDITSIPETAFDGLYNLTELDLGHNQIRTLNASVFHFVTELKELRLHHNHLSEIPDIGPLYNLTTLSLHNNNIFSISISVLEKYPSLRFLDLNYNRIVDIPTGTFPNNIQLQHLYVSNNKIVSLEKGAFDNLTSLESLKLNKNRLTHIPKDLFRRLHSLKYLELNRNKLQQIEGLSFQGLDSLAVLKLRSNSITRLLDGAFWSLTNIQVLHLDHNNISKITKGWLYGLTSLQQLSLSHNNIAEVEEDGWEFCKRLSELDLTHNKLLAITKETLQNLHSLRKLYLDHNMVSYIEEGAFRSLSSLQILELNHNEISWSVEDTNGAFYGMEKLKHLGISHNRIKSIAKKAFTGLVRLTTLDLSHNPIIAIQENAFGGLKRLHELRLNSSKLLCDCSLRWFPTWLSSSGLKKTVVPKCGHPEWLKNKTIYEAKPENFTCDDFPKPYITQHPQTQTALKGENVTLVCKAASSSSSPTSFQWRKENKLLLDAKMENFANTIEKGITEYSSLLHLQAVQDKDEGRYQCIISNQFGSVYSQKARITVHVFPVFVKTPEDVTVKAGSTARLECAAKGQPSPNMTWQKDGGNDFPAARERRMHVMPSDDVFFIVNTKASDLGTYSCTAQNAAGIIMANATLVVLETPTFVRPMVDKETREGETAVLECMASGSPKPNLTWTKDGGPLLATERHFFTADNQLLIIVQTQSSDSGEYSCEMSNTLGMERDSSCLTILPVSSGDSKGEEDNIAGLIIISVVCCIVGTSLIWVVIIYKSRKRDDDYSPTNTDETTLPCDIPPFTSYPSACAEDFKGSASHLFLDSTSEHSSKDSGTGDSTQRSSDELLPPEDSSHTTLGLPSKKSHFNHLAIGGANLGDALDSENEILDNAAQNSPSTFPISSAHNRQQTPLLCKSYLRKSDSTQKENACVNGFQTNSPLADVEIHYPRVPASEVTRWPCHTYSAENLPVTTVKKDGDDWSTSGSGHQNSETILTGLDGARSCDIERDSGFSTFPRGASPASNHSLNTRSLQFQKQNRVQSDSGSFSVESEDLQAVQECIQHHSPSLSKSQETFVTTSVDPVSQHCENRHSTDLSHLVKVA